MRSIWTGAIGFGLVNIPVKMYSATSSSTLDLDMLDKKDLAPIRFLRVNEHTGKEVQWQNIVKGYNYNGRYIVLDDKDFESASAKKSKFIEISDFVDETEINSLFYETPYYLEPDKTGIKAYALLREALRKSGKVGLGTYVLRNRENLAVIKPENDVLVLNKIRFMEEIRDTEELNLPGKPVIKPAELKMAMALIDQLSGPFDVEKYKDTYSSQLMKVIEAKAKGKKTTTPKLKIVHSRAEDLMDQLKASLKTTKPAKTTKTRKAS